MSEDAGSDDDALLPEPPQHTIAKHRILVEYLNAWLPILQYEGRIVYLDGFAGPGKYKGGMEGSPILAIEAARKHQHLERLSKEIIFVFVELMQKRVEHLRGMLGEKYGELKDENYSALPGSFKISVLPGDFNQVIALELDQLTEKKANLAPTLAFVDPFGYSALNIDVLAKILSYPKCELLITYMTGFLDRFNFDKSKEEMIVRTLGVEHTQLEAIRALPEQVDRETAWLKILNDAIVARAVRIAGKTLTVYPLYFNMRDKNNNTVYHLVYLTKSVKGLDVMKRAMGVVGRNWSYRFSDYGFNPSQSTVLDYIDEKPWLLEASKKVFEEFKGKTVPVEQIKEYVLTQTIGRYKVDILTKLEDESKIVEVKNRKMRRTYPEGCKVTFVAD